MQNSSSPRPQCRLPFPPFFPPFCPCHTRLAPGEPVGLSGPPFPHVFIARPRMSVLQLLCECVADVAEGPSPPKTFCSCLLLSTWPCGPPSAPGAGEGLSHRTRRPEGITRGPSSQALSGRLQGRLSRTHLALMAFALGKPCLSLLPSINPACTCCVCLCVSCNASPLPSGFDEINYESLTLLCAGQVPSDGEPPSVRAWAPCSRCLYVTEGSAFPPQWALGRFPVEGLQQNLTAWVVF